MGLEENNLLLVVYLHFLDKEYLLILRRYQLHLASATTSCPNGIKDAHNQKKEKEITKKKSPATEIKTLKQQH
jgi:hypothetical protein